VRRTARSRLARKRAPRGARSGRQDTRSRLIEVAAQLFWERGYTATGIAEIVHQSDVFAGSLYHFFPTKQRLLASVLEWYRDQIDRTLLLPAWEGVTDPIARVFALLAGYRAALVATNCSYGCPIGSLANELREPEPEIRQLLAANFSQWVAAVKRCLDDAAPRLPRGINRNGVAQFVLSVMEGAVMQARTYRSLEAFDASVECLRDYFNRLESDATRASGQAARKA
jgi:TetR/AcrR family transcriptional regulator, transcriptional repressor for nem operon